MATVKETANGFRDLRKATAVLTEIVLFQNVVVIVRRAHESDILVFDEVWDRSRKPVGLGDHVRVERSEILRRAVVGCREGKTRANVAGLVVMALANWLVSCEVHDVLILRSACAVRAVEVVDGHSEILIGSIVQNKDPESLGRILLDHCGCDGIHYR